MKHIVYNIRFLYLAYQTMLKQVNAEVGVWDDHDYGLNNSGESFVFKHQMR